MKVNKLKATVLLVVAIGIVAGMASAEIYAALSTSQSVSATGTVSAVNLVVQNTSGQTITSLNWGDVANGTTATQQVIVENPTGGGDVPEVLSIAINSLAPSGCGITLTWNEQGVTLNPGASVTATLTLTVPSTITTGTNFSFNIVFTGTET